MNTKTVIKRRFAILPVILLLAVTAVGQTELLTVDSIFTYRTRSLGPVRWQPDGSGYLALEPSPNKRNFVDLVRYDTATGNRTVKVSAEKLIPTGANRY
jgi:hypothetical protein